MKSMANVMLARQQRCALQVLRGGRRQQLQQQQSQQQQQQRGRGRLFLSSSANHPNKGRPPMPRVMPTSSNPATTSTATTPNHNPIRVTPSAAGTGRGSSNPAVDKALYGISKSRTPVTWTSLFVAAVTAASAVAYYRIERERRLEQALGKIVTSESLIPTIIAPDNASSSSSNNNNNHNDNNNINSNAVGSGGGWTPKPDVLAPRQFVKTRAGWMPRDDGWGAPGKPAIGGPWSLVDLKGNLVTNESFKGKWLLLYFGFARCPDICPSEMNKVATVLDTLKQQYPALYKQIVPIFVSVDPARDSLQALADYAKDFHPDYIFLTGTPEQVQRMAKKYRVYMSKAEETEQGDYLVDHSIVIYLHDDTGDLADCLTQSMRPTDVVNKVVERMTFVPKY